MSLIYLDIETDNSEGYNGLDVFSGRVVTVQMLLPSGKPIIIKDPTSLDTIKPILENNLIIGHNLKFDAKFLKQQFGITLRNVYDTQIAEIILSGGLYAGQKNVVRLQDLVLR
jgi:ribonuclease D